MLCVSRTSFWTRRLFTHVATLYADHTFLHRSHLNASRTSVRTQQLFTHVGLLYADHTFLRGSHRYVPRTPLRTRRLCTHVALLYADHTFLQRSHLNVSRTSVGTRQLFTHVALLYADITFSRTTHLYASLANSRRAPPHHCAPTTKTLRSRESFLEHPDGLGRPKHLFHLEVHHHLRNTLGAPTKHCAATAVTLRTSELVPEHPGLCAARSIPFVFRYANAETNIPTRDEDCPRRQKTLLGFVADSHSQTCVPGTQTRLDFSTTERSRRDGTVS